MEAFIKFAKYIIKEAEDKYNLKGLADSFGDNVGKLWLPALAATLASGGAAGYYTASQKKDPNESEDSRRKRILKNSLIAAALGGGTSLAAIGGKSLMEHNFEPREGGGSSIGDMVANFSQHPARSTLQGGAMVGLPLAAGYAAGYGADALKDRLQATDARRLARSQLASILAPHGSVVLDPSMDALHKALAGKGNLDSLINSKVGNLTVYEKLRTALQTSGLHDEELDALFHQAGIKNPQSFRSFDGQDIKPISDLLSKQLKDIPGVGSLPLGIHAKKTIAEVMPSRGTALTKGVSGLGAAGVAAYGLNELFNYMNNVSK